MSKGAAIAIAGAVAALGLVVYLSLDRSPEARLEDQWAMLGDYCVECHNDSDYTGDLSFEGRGPDDIHANPGVWEEVVRKLRIGVMPPREQRQPEPELRADRKSVV